MLANLIGFEFKFICLQKKNQIKNFELMFPYTHKKDTSGCFTFKFFLFHTKVIQLKRDYVFVVLSSKKHAVTHGKPICPVYLTTRLKDAKVLKSF